MIEGPKLAQLVASKICHDMVEPMNGMIQGLEMLKESDIAGKNADALGLLEQGIAKAWAKLDFFRFALAGGLASDGEGMLDEIRPTAERLYGVLKPNLVWAPGGALAPKAALRITLNLLMPAAECLPKGGTVRIEAGPHASGGEIKITAEGLKAKLKPDTAAALRGETPETGFQGYSVQPALIYMLARQSGAEILTREAP